MPHVFFLTALFVVASREIVEEERVHNGHPPVPHVHTPSFFIGIVVVEQTPVNIQITILALRRRSHSKIDALGRGKGRGK